MNEGPERIDYRETSDITEVHAAIKREHRDPVAETTPIPLWLTTLCGATVCWAGAYLGVFHGGFSGDIYNEYESSPAALFPIPKKAGGKDTEPVAAQTLVQLGKVVYSQCQACHQANGQGLAGQFPPLANSEFVVGGEKRLLGIILKGLQGPITVSGKPYNGVMVPWESGLTDKKIAAVASYIRSEWGNTAPEISEAKVAAARKEFAGQAGSFTEASLFQIPADANVEGVATEPAASTAPGAAKAAPGVTAAGVADPAFLAMGKQQYMTICAACHMPTGTGLPPVFPSLIKTEYVVGDPKRFAAMILKGVMGPMTVDGKLYNGVMPAQEMMLTDTKIAAVLSFVRSSFGNSSPPVAPEVVAAARKEFADRKTSWTEAELKAFESGAPAPAAPVTPPSVP